MLRSKLLRPGSAKRIVVILLFTVCFLLKADVFAQPQDRGLVLAGAPSGSALDGRGKLWAVVIGVSKYRNLAPQQQLAFAHRDAEDFAAPLDQPIPFLD